MTSDSTEVHLPVLPTGDAAKILPDAPPPQPSSAVARAAASSVEPAAPLSLIERKLLEGKVIEAIRTIYDPEIPVNIHELGLIYEINVKEDSSVDVKMTLTAPACPVAGTLPGQVETRIEEIPEVSKANVELVWDPPWSRELMSEAAQLQLGFL